MTICSRSTLIYINQDNSSAYMLNISLVYSGPHHHQSQQTVIHNQSLYDINIIYPQDTRKSFTLGNQWEIFYTGKSVGLHSNIFGIDREFILYKEIIG